MVAYAIEIILNGTLGVPVFVLRELGKYHEQDKKSTHIG